MGGRICRTQVGGGTKGGDKGVEEVGDLGVDEGGFFLHPHLLHYLVIH